MYKSDIAIGHVHDSSVLTKTSDCVKMDTRNEKSRSVLVKVQSSADNICKMDKMAFEMYSTVNGICRHIGIWQDFAHTNPKKIFNL